MDTQRPIPGPDVGLLRYNRANSWWVDGFILHLEDANIKTAAAGGPTGPRRGAVSCPRTLG